MLKLDNKENLIMLFFVVTLFLLGIYVVINKNTIDVIYLCVILYYFIKFLVVRSKDC